MRRKCFTLVELLVVIGIIAVLLSILLPALSAVKRSAQRVVCASNLAGIGKAIQLYANEYGGDYPRSCGPDKRWGGNNGSLYDWTAQSSSIACGRGDSVTITSCLFFLVKWEEATTSQFNCRGDSGVRELKLSDALGGVPTFVDDITDVWDFGCKNNFVTGTATWGWPGQYNSYSYHNPFYNNSAKNSFPLGSYSNPASPVCADRNPYWDKNATIYLNGNACDGDDDEEPPSCNATEGYSDRDKTGNSASHQRDGQNVLFNDTHVRFERFPNVGITKDNIWKCWNSTNTPTTNCARENGVEPTCGNRQDGDFYPFSDMDALLVSETNKRP